MRTILASLLLLPALACGGTGDASDASDDTGATGTETGGGDSTGPTPTTGEPEGDLNERELGASASAECLAAAPKVVELTQAVAAGDAVAAAAAYAGPLQAYVKLLDAANGRTDDAEIGGWLEAGMPAGLTAVAARVHVALYLQYKGRLADVEEGAPDRFAAWDEAHCAFEAGLHALATEADGVTWHAVDESIVGDIEEALQTGHDGIGGEPPDTTIDEWRVLSSKQKAEKSMIRAFHRVIVEEAGKQEALAARRALELFAAIEDRLDGRNTPGIQQVKDILGGDPATIDATVILDELDLAFSKRTRRYATVAIEEGEVATPAGYEGAVEGHTYAKLILPGMLARVQGANAVAYLGEWGAYADLVRSGEDEASLGVVSTRIADQTCAYQTALGIAECTGDADEAQ